ncbi:MAG: hypothetical protein HYS76_01310, partial [Candidatus Wildermuthbacteria bacterium]|nr:hypothetical protein [Candidatus Wildermuthbacteria bacterium]
NVQGELFVLDVPPANQSYAIRATKSGYSTDQTQDPHTPPNPVLPHATVSAGQSTQISFRIDKTSSLLVESVTQVCAPVPSVSFSLTGSKLVATNPAVKKYSEQFETSSAGQKTVSNLEWDQYALALQDSSYDTRGIIPSSPFSLVPDTALRMSNLCFLQACQSARWSM